MNLTHPANGLNTLTGAASGTAQLEEALLAEPPAADAAADLEELDDDVEALIVCMDRTTAEHLFLHAQRPIPCHGTDAAARYAG